MQSHSETKIHPTAVIYPGAELGVDVEIGPYSVVGPNVKVGDRCKLASHVVVEGHTTLGEENHIWQFASVGSAPQDLKYRNEPTTLVIGARNKIREYVTLQPGTVNGGGVTTIGDMNLFMASSHVAHDCVVGSFNVFANSVALAGHVTVGDRVILGGLSAVHQFVRIGNLAMLGGGSMVGQDVPPFVIVQGYPARLRGVNVIGLKRAGFSVDEASAVKKMFRHLFLTQGLVKERIATLPEELRKSQLVIESLQFIEGSQRGIITSVISETEDAG